GNPAHGAQLHHSGHQAPGNCRDLRSMVENVYQLRSFVLDSLISSVRASPISISSCQQSLSDKPIGLPSLDRPGRRMGRITERRGSAETTHPGHNDWAIIAHGFLFAWRSPIITTSRLARSATLLISPSSTTIGSPATPSCAREAGIPLPCCSSATSQVPCRPV
ncbi:uncharacterized protein PV07_06901, partial [Cladophialophora immunda]